MEENIEPGKVHIYMHFRFYLTKLAQQKVYNSIFVIQLLYNC